MNERPDIPGAPGGHAFHKATRLRWRIVGVLLVASILPLGLVSAGAWVVFGGLLEEKALELQRTVVRNHTNAIELFIFSRLRALDLVALSHPFEDLSNEVGLERVFESLRDTYGETFIDLGVIGSDGAHLAYVGPYDLKNRNYAGAEWFRHVMSKHVYVSDVFIGFRRVPHCVIAVKRQDHSRTWVLRATINSDRFDALVRTGQLGSTGDAFIVNTEGIYQTASRYGRVLERSHLTAPEVHGGVRETRVTIGGRTMVQATSWLNNDRWMLVVLQDLNEIKAPVYRAILWGAVVVSLAVLVIAATTMLATRHLTRQIDRANEQRDELSRNLLRSAKLASLGELSSGLAHEINNPLAIMSVEQTNIADVVGALEIEPAAKDEVLQSVERCQKQIERCGNITAKMLQFGRAGEARLRPTEIGPRLDEIVALLQKQAQVRNVSMKVEVERDLPPVVLDPTELQQVIVNLINNSLYAISNGGSIRVSARREDSNVVVTVSDTGCGIPPELLDRVFQPFFTTKPVSQGTGLGLSVCYGIVQNWGGTMEARSRVGAGTEMIIRLPMGRPGEDADRKSA
jgi:two-component system NtrC family sensor kinase